MEVPIMKRDKLIVTGDLKNVPLFTFNPDLIESEMDKIVLKLNSYDPLLNGLKKMLSADPLSLGHHFQGLSDLLKDINYKFYEIKKGEK